MARYTGPKHRLARRENTNVLEKASQSLARRLSIPPGMHGQKRTRRQSEFAIQLREKQKARKVYGLMEKQFRNYFARAAKVKGKTGEVLLASLERRLDNALYRLGFTSSRALARQLISHGHVLVSGRKMSIPSYLLRVGEVITLAPRAMEIPVVKKLLEAKDYQPPVYFERKAAAGRLLKVPGRDDIPTDLHEQLIIEYYSR